MDHFGTFAPQIRFSGDCGFAVQACRLGTADVRKNAHLRHKASFRSLSDPVLAPGSEASFCRETREVTPGEA